MIEVYNGICIGAVHEREKLRELFDAFGAMVRLWPIGDVVFPGVGVCRPLMSDFEKVL